MDRFRPVLEEIETRDNPSVSPADVFSAAAGIDYSTAVLMRILEHPSYVQSPTTQTFTNAQLGIIDATSTAAIGVLDQFIAGLQQQGAAAAPLIQQATALETQARANLASAQALEAYIAANPAPKANAAVIGADGTVTVFGPAGTPVASGGTGTNGTVNTGSNSPIGNIPGTGINGGTNTGVLSGGGSTTNTTGTNTGSGTGTQTSGTTGTTGTGTNTSGTNTGTNGTGSTSGSGTTTGTTGTTSSTATP